MDSGDEDSYSACASRLAQGEEVYPAICSGLTLCLVDVTNPGKDWNP